MDGCQCDTCWYYDYDEEYDEYYCMMDLDEDEYYRVFASGPLPSSPSFPSRVTLQASCCHGYSHHPLRSLTWSSRGTKAGGQP